MLLRMLEYPSRIKRSSESDQGLELVKPIIEIEQIEKDKEGYEKMVDDHKNLLQNIIEI